MSAYWRWLLRYGRRIPEAFSIAICALAGLFFVVVLVVKPYPRHPRLNPTRRFVQYVLSASPGLLVAGLGLFWSLRAARNSKQVITTFVNMQSSFEELVAHANDKFVCKPQHAGVDTRIDLALLSPALGSLYLGKPDICESFLSRLEQLPPATSLTMLCLGKEELKLWYSAMLRLLVKGWRETTPLTENEIKQQRVLPMLHSTIKHISDARVSVVSKIFPTVKYGERVFRTTKYLPIQIFLKRDGSARRAMYGIMGSEFPAQALDALKAPSYQLVLDFSRGLYSEMPQVVTHYQRMYDQLWARGQEIKTRGLLEAYFSGVEGHLRQLLVNPAPLMYRY